MTLKILKFKKQIKTLHDNDEINLNTLDWFDIRNYECVREYTREKLSFQLSIRAIIYGDNLEHDLKNGIDKKFLIQMVSLLSSKKFLSKDEFEDDEKSISEFSDYDFWESFIKILFNKKAQKRFDYTYAELRELLIESDDEVISDLAIDVAFDKGGFKDDMLNWNNHILHIDTNFSDEKIIYDVKNWLKEKRTHQKKRQRISDVEFRKWITQPRLAYIDLYLWQKITGNEITYPEIVQLLYPDDRNMTPDNFKKTIAEKTIKEFMDKGFHYRFL